MLRMTKGGFLMCGMNVTLATIIGVLICLLRCGGASSPGSATHLAFGLFFSPSRWQQKSSSSMLKTELFLPLTHKPLSFPHSPHLGGEQVTHRSSSHGVKREWSCSWHTVMEHFRSSRSCRFAAFFAGSSLRPSWFKTRMPMNPGPGKDIAPATRHDQPEQAATAIEKSITQVLLGNQPGDMHDDRYRR